MVTIENAVFCLAAHVPCIVFGACFCKAIELGHNRLAIAGLVLAFFASPAVRIK